MTKTFSTLSSAIALSIALSGAASADAYSFEGIYGGLSVGSSSPDLNFVPVSVDSAVELGIFGGYNHAIDSNWVVGGELSFSRSGDHGVPGTAAEISFENMITLSARAGYVFDNTMVYGRIGYQTGELSISTAPITPDLDGAVFGLGVEHMFTENISGRFEVTHSHLDVSGVPLPGADLDRTGISVGVAFHF